MFAQPELVPVTIATAFVAGVLLALLGSIKLSLAKRLQINEGRVGGLLSAFFLAVMPLMLVNGVLIDRWGVQWVLILAALLSALALTGLALSRSYQAALGSLLALGMGWAGLSNAGTILMVPAFFGKDSATASVLLGNVFFGVGALVTPALADYLIRLLTYRKGLAVVALICLGPAVLCLGPGASEAIAALPRGAGSAGLLEVLKSPVLWLAALAFALYAPLESILGTWATTFLTDLRMPERRAALLLSGFWLAYLTARLAVALAEHAGWMDRSAEPWLIVGLALVAAMVLGSLAGAPDVRVAGRRLLMAGALFGPIFPTLVGVLLGHTKQNQATAYGAMFCFGAVGNLIFPPLFGAYARRHGTQRALRFTPVLALALAGAALVLGLWLQL